MRPIHGCPEYFRDFLTTYVHGYYSQHFSWAFVPIDPMNVPTKFEVRNFTRSWDNRGTQKIWAVPGYAHAPYSPKFLMGFYSDWPCNRQICGSWDKRGVAKLQTRNRGRGGHRGSGMVPFERALMSFYRPSIVTFALSLRVSEISPLLFSSTPLTFSQPTFSLPKISPCSPGNRWTAFWLQRGKVLG